MKYLLDTNIISELVKPQPNENVISFIRKCDEKDLYLSVITIGEIKYGTEKSQNSIKKEGLHRWLYEDLLKRFESRIIEIDVEIMLSWAKNTQKLNSIGKPMPVMDLLIASSCMAKNFLLVTRNEKDFCNIDIEIINPFNG